MLWLGRFYWVYIVYAMTLEAYVSFPLNFIGLLNLILLISCCALFPRGFGGRDDCRPDACLLDVLHPQ